MDELVKTAATLLSDKWEHTKEAMVDANHLLEDQVDTLGDIVGLSEKINMNWRNSVHLQSNLAKQLNLSKIEEVKAKMMVAASIGDEQDRAKTILASIQQRQKFLEKEINMMRVLNASMFTPFIFLFKETMKLFLPMDKAITGFNIGLGLMRSNTRSIQVAAQQLAINLMDVGVTIDGIYKSWEALATSFGSVYIVSTELVKTTALLKAQLGVSEEHSAKFLRNISFLSGKTMETQKNMAFIAADMSRAAGTKLDQVMADVATHSDTTLVMMSRIPEIAIKSAIEFRRLGTSLESVANASRHILSFTENINEEMEASVLLGHSINLQKARELAYHKDLEGSNREILKLAKQNRIEQMDPYQAEAFARATGRSVDELMNMVQADKEWTNARLNGTDAVKAQIAEYEKLHSANKAVLDDRGKQFEIELMQKSNQERLIAIQQKWNQLIAQLLPPVLLIVDAFLSLAPAIVPVIPLLAGMAGLIGKIASATNNARELWNMATVPISNFQKMLLSIDGGLAMIGNKFKWITSISTRLSTFFKSISVLAGGLSRVGPLLATFGKWVPILGWVITAFQFVNGFIDGMKGHSGWQAVFYGILGGIKAVVMPIFDLIMWPFNAAWTAMTGHPLVGQSPSKLGLAIVKGIVSVGAMLYDALTYPFRHAFAWILDHIPGMGKMAAGLRGGFGGVATTINHKMEGVSNITGVPQKAPEQAIEVAKEQVSTVKEQTSQNDDGNKLLQSILIAIQTLNKNLKDGAIAVNIDSQRLSSTLSKNLAFSGNFGSNQ